MTATSSAISTTANTMRVAQKSGMKKSSSDASSRLTAGATSTVSGGRSAGGRR